MAVVVDIVAGGAALVVMLGMIVACLRLERACDAGELLDELVGTTSRKHRRPGGPNRV